MNKQLEAKGQCYVSVIALFKPALLSSQMHSTSLHTYNYYGQIIDCLCQRFFDARQVNSSVATV